MNDVDNGFSLLCVLKRKKSHDELPIFCLIHICCSLYILGNSIWLVCFNRVLLN